MQRDALFFSQLPIPKKSEGLGLKRKNQTGQFSKLAQTLTNAQYVLVPQSRSPSKVHHVPNMQARCKLKIFKT